MNMMNVPGKQDIMLIIVCEAGIRTVKSIYEEIIKVGANHPSSRIPDDRVAADLAEMFVTVPTSQRDIQAGWEALETFVSRTSAFKQMPVKNHNAVVVSALASFLPGHFVTRVADTMYLNDWDNQCFDAAKNAIAANPAYRKDTYASASFYHQL